MGKIKKRLHRKSVDEKVLQKVSKDSCKISIAKEKKNVIKKDIPSIKLKI